MSLMESKFNEIFLDSDDKSLEINGEGIESIVTKNFYDKVFNVQEEKEVNEKISKSIMIHQ